ncbi:MULTISPECIES: phage antirepressor KilAC domain-containing protein [Lachnospiraceae]|nr:MULTISPECIES: phage antirepressor KilAC domain-containing protein [Lachnospiraceae]
MNMYNTELGAGPGKESGVSELQIFENQVFGQVRVFVKNGEPWFVAADVCKAMEIAPTAIRRLDDDEKAALRLTQTSSNGVVQNREVAAVNEPGLMENPEAIYTLAEQLLAEKGKNKEISKQLKMAQPKADYFDAFVNSADCTCIRYCGKELGVPQNMFVSLLMEHKYLYRDRNGWLMPYSDKVEKGYFIVRDCYARSGKLVQQTRMTCKGKSHISRVSLQSVNSICI